MNSSGKSKKDLPLSSREDPVRTGGGVLTVRKEKVFEKGRIERRTEENERAFPFFLRASGRKKIKRREKSIRIEYWVLGVVSLLTRPAF